MPQPTPTHILLVDDDVRDRAAVAQMLRAADWQVRAVESADAIAAAEGVDLILLRAETRDAAGNLLSLLFKRCLATVDIPLLLLSEENSDDPAADGQLTIPVRPAELLSTVRLLLRMRRMEQCFRADRRRLEEQFRQAQKLEAVGRLASGVAHDFNNVLTAITGYSELILLDGGDDANPLVRHAEEIRKASERGAALSRQLLAYGRQQPVAARVLSLNTVVADLEKLLQRLLRADVSLTLRLHPGLRRVSIDPGQVEQVLMNLVVNACDAMPLGGALTIATANVELDEAYAWAHADVQPGAYAMLAVSDTGSGMSDEVRAHMFEPFFTTKAPGKGTGLGLATVHGIVRDNGGHIEVLSGAGAGTTFRVYIPQVMEAAKPDALPAGHGRLASGSETILLVEDEEIVRNLTRTVLQRQGYQVLQASHGVEALRVSEGYVGPIHLLLTDVVMPHMNGRDLARRLGAQRPATKVMFMSGYTGLIDDPDEGMNGSAAFLHKPFAPDALARQVRALLDA